MIIGFDKMDEKEIKNFKGGEKEFNVRMFDDGSAKVMKCRLAPGASIGYHKHEGNSEIIFVLSGSGAVKYDGEMLAIKSGEAHYCPEGHEHSLINNSNEDLVFFAVVPQL